jgi:hypothetical protein
LNKLIQSLALKILDQKPDPVVHYRLLRDVLHVPPDVSELDRAKVDLKCSRWISELSAEQRVDGSWGPFHSQSTRLKQKILTTEMGVDRALALGLDANHPILNRTVDYIVDVIESRKSFPDTPEKNDRWPTGVRLFLASTLSLIAPDHPILDADRALWSEIARRAFQSGEYQEDDEIKAHAELTGATVKGSYLVLRRKYQLNILGSLPGTLSFDLETALLKWLLQRPDGIGYLSVPLNIPPVPHKASVFDHWLASIEMLSRLFPSWSHHFQSSLQWIWDQRHPDGYWDFGSRSSSATFFPLSEDWKSRQKRRFDWTARILILLHRKTAESQGNAG